jgi:amino acid transporter
MEWILLPLGLLIVGGVVKGTILHMIFIAFMVGVIVFALAVMGVSIGGFVLSVIASLVGAVVIVFGIILLMSSNSHATPKLENPFLDKSVPFGADGFTHDKVCSSCSKRMMRVQRKCPHCGADAP